MSIIKFKNEKICKITKILKTFSSFGIVRLFYRSLIFKYETSAIVKFYFWKFWPSPVIFKFRNINRSTFGRSKFRPPLKLFINILHPSRNFGIEFRQNRLKRSNFFRFWIFWNFFQNCLNQASFDLLSWSFLRKYTNTEWCLILDFCENRWRLLNFRRNWIFLFILPWHQILKIRCIHEASWLRKPKSSNALPQTKKFVKSVRKQ